MKKLVCFLLAVTLVVLLSVSSFASEADQMSLSEYEENSKGPEPLTPASQQFHYVLQDSAGGFTANLTVTVSGYYSSSLNVGYITAISHQLSNVYDPQNYLSVTSWVSGGKGYCTTRDPAIHPHVGGWQYSLSLRYLQK